MNRNLLLLRSMLMALLLVIGAQGAMAENAIYGSWSNYETKNTVANDKVTVHLEENTNYWFYLWDSNNSSAKFCNSGTMTNTNNSGWKFTSTETTYCGIHTDKAGDYVFNVEWKQESGTWYPYVSVTYPSAGPVATDLYMWYQIGTDAWTATTSKLTTDASGIGHYTITGDDSNKDKKMFVTFSKSSSVDWADPWRCSTNTEISPSTEYTKGSGSSVWYIATLEKGYNYTFNVDEANNKFSYDKTHVGPTVTFSPVSGTTCTDASNAFVVTISGGDGNSEYNCIVNKDGHDVKTETFTMPTASETKTVYDAKENGTYVLTVKNRTTNEVIATATYTVAIETKYAINVKAGANGSVSPSGNINVGTTPVAITATPASGYQFKQWTTTGNVTVANAVSASTTITATGTGNVMALFEEYTAPDMSYYLVGNFFDNDPADAINYDRRYFKFNIQSDGRYMVEIPAAVTARAQIIGVTDHVYKFGPSSATYDIKSTWPTTDMSATGTFASEGTSNYWNLTTRNDNTSAGDDDGLYEVWLTAGADGTPTAWEFKHVSTRRVAYFLSTAPGATVNPVYNERQSSTHAFDNKTYAMVYINPEQSYYTIGYVLRDKESDYINKANNTVSGGYGAHVNNKNQDVLPTTNKLFLMGNNGRTFKAENPYNEVSPHVNPIVVNKEKGLYKVEYNPSNGNNEWAKGTHVEQPNDEKNTVGIRGQIIFLGGDMGGTGYDSPIASISMVGNAIPGTTNSNGTWNWASTAGDMTYDENEGCYKLTIQTTASESTANQFRFVANHDKKMTWYEDGIEDAKKARVPYLEDGDGHSCMPTDPNPVSYTVTDNTANTDVNIIFNRPAGTWTVRFYIDINEQGQKSYRYTITGKENNDVLLTYRHNKFIRTYSNDIPMDLTDGVKAYIAYKFVPAENNDKYGNCKVYLRQMDYIPAYVGVVLIGTAPDGYEFSDGEKLNFSLQKRVDEVPDDLREVWTKHDTYINVNNDAWHNFLVPTVDAVDNLGNAEANNDGKIIYRYFGLSSYYNTAYYKSTRIGDDYIGFFRLTEQGKSGANKAYLSIPSSENTNVPDEDKRLYGVLDFNAQLSGQKTDEGENTSLAKAMLLFDDEDFDDAISTSISTVNVNASNDNNCYTLQGIKVMNPTKGLYIKNGKKYIFK